MKRKQISLCRCNRVDVDFAASCFTFILRKAFWRTCFVRSCNPLDQALWRRALLISIKITSMIELRTLSFSGVEFVALERSWTKWFFKAQELVLKDSSLRWNLGVNLFCFNFAFMLRLRVKRQKVSARFSDNIVFSAQAVLRSHLRPMLHERMCLLLIVPSETATFPARPNTSAMHFSFFSFITRWSHYCE